MIQTLLLACIQSCQTTGNFGTVSRIYGMVKSLSSNKLKPIFFPEGGKSSSYVMVVASINGVDVILRSYGPN